jgi:putative membrane protein insertion efficiency factor
MKYLKALFTWPIRVYQYLISPLWGRRCCFVPSCSAYMLQAIQKHGVVKGLFLGIKRILRCHPWGGCGYDPVPPDRGLSEQEASPNHRNGKH